MPDKISTNSIYSGTHWRVRAGMADTYKKSMLQFKNKYKIDEYPVDCEYIFRFSGKMLDVSNCTYMVKLVEDGLKHIGLLKDDNINYVQSISIKVEKGPKDEIELILV